MSKILETIKKELQSWPYVTAEPHRFGGIEFRLNKREMGHIHGDRVADLPFPMDVRNKANNCSTRHYERATGLETWFTLPDLKAIVAPPKWKMAIVTFIAAYSISSLVTFFFTLSHYIRQSPFVANTIMTIILVAGLTYFAMPILSRLLQRWLYPSSEHLQQ